MRIKSNLGIHNMINREWYIPLVRISHFQRRTHGFTKGEAEDIAVTSSTESTDSLEAASVPGGRGGARNTRRDALSLVTGATSKLRL